MKMREKENLDALALAIWNNGIIIISNQISVTEAKNTHHIKAMTRREKEKEKREQKKKDSIILFYFILLPMF
jgi:hypothetical protein